MHSTFSTAKAGRHEVTVETISHSGTIVIRSEYDSAGDCIKQSYQGYTKRQALQAFAKHLSEIARSRGKAMLQPC